MIASVTTSQSNKEKKNIGASMLNLFMRQKNEKMKKKNKSLLDPFKNCQVTTW
jgi:hypothetical protein